MKTPIYIILTLSILLMGCQSSESGKEGSEEKETPELKEETKDTKVVKSHTKKNLTPKIVKAYSGFYMNEAFLKKVEKEKSIYKAGEFEGGYFGFHLKADELKTGKTKIYGFTHHEGGYETNIEWMDEYGRFTNSGKGEEFSHLKHSLFDVVVLKNGNIELQFEDSHSEFYRKAESDFSELRRILFQGFYQDMEGNKVTFAENGDVQGIQVGSYFHPLYDFTEGLFFDVIFVNETKDNYDGVKYHYQFSGDTLKLFEIKGEFPEFEIGEIKYSLIKE